MTLTNKAIAACISIISLASILTFIPLKVFSQQGGDYVIRPVSEIQYTSLELHLEAGFEEKTIRGSARYHFRPKHAYVDSISWMVPGMDILKLELDGQKIPYSRNGDSLVISFDDHPDPAQQYTIAVSYESKPAFGVHFKHNGTIFSSTLPGSVAHWLPGPIHPRVSMPVTITLEAPGNYNAVATGSPSDEQATEKGRKFVFSSDNETPVSELFFAVGDFAMEESFSGTKNIRVYHEHGVVEDGRSREILSYMIQRIREHERYFRSELPVSAFHTLILSDDKWETRPYAAGIAVFSSPQGQIETLISRAIASQWIGISSRAEQWADSRFIVLLQALVAEELDDPEWQSVADPLEQAFRVPRTLYSEQTMERWQWARRYLRDQAPPLLSDVLPYLVRDFSGNSGVYEADDFSRMAYQKTGRWISYPVINEPVPESKPVYRVLISETRDSERLALAFVPTGDYRERVNTATINWTHNGEFFDRQVEFRGTGDTLNIPINGRVSNVWISAGDDSDVNFEIDKPFSFWLYQLRRDDRPEKRREAALALKDHDSDPDLQLAVQDIMNREENTEVLAALYRLMAKLTSGASGTERRFLEGVTSPDAEIRMVSMQSLKAYPGNSQVQNRVLEIIQTSDDIPLVNQAVRTYRNLIDEDEFRDFAIRFLREDRQELLFTKTLLEELFEVPVDDTSFEAAVEYLNPGYAFKIRWLAYIQLSRFAADREWQADFARNNSDDPDPRIRFAAIFSVPQIDLQDQVPFLQSHMLLEYDIRILKQASELANAE